MKKGGEREGGREGGRKEGGAVEYDCESDGINRRLIPRNVADVVSDALEHILKLVRGRCMEQQQVWTLFVVVVVVLAVQIHSIIQCLQLLSWMAVIQTVMMTLDL